MPSKQATTDYRHGAKDNGPAGFSFAVTAKPGRRQVLAWTRNEQQARLLAWALNMREAMREVANQEFVDWWISWLGELSQDENENGGRS